MTGGGIHQTSADGTGCSRQSKPAVGVKRYSAWPLVDHSSIPKSLRSCLETVLVNLHQQNAGALEVIKAGWTEALPANRYEKITDKDCLRWLKTP